MISAFLGCISQSLYAQELREGPPLPLQQINVDQSPELRHQCANLGNATPLRDGPAINLGQHVYISTIVITGATAISGADLKKITCQFEGQALSKSDMQNLANRLTEAYVDRGFILSKAMIEQQSFANGVLSVRISEGYINNIEINDDTDHPLLPSLRKILNERPLTKATFEREFSLVRTKPGFRITNRNIKRDPDTADGYVMALTVSRKRLQTSLNVTNAGVREGEAWRMFLNAKINSVLTSGDELSLGYLLKPAAPSEVKYFVGGYEMPLGSNGLSAFIAGTISNSQPTSALVGRNLNGTLRNVSFGIKYPILLTSQKQLVVSTNFDWLNSREVEGAAMLYKDRLRLLQFRADYRTAFARKGGALASLELTQGLDAFNASDRAGDFTSRPDGDAQFFKLSGIASIQKYFWDRVSLKTSFIGQFASSPLLFSEEFSLGGGQYGRGYDYGEILGDLGAAGFVEAGFHGKNLGPIKQWEIYSYADVGVVWNKGVGLSVDGDPLYSAGGGVRLNLSKNLFFTYEAAKPLSDAPYTDQDGNVRHRFQITVIP